MRRNSPIPTVVGEHENNWKGVFREEIPKLMASNAELKVLICYLPPARQEKGPSASGTPETLGQIQRIEERVPPDKIMARNVMVREWQGFSIFWFHQGYVASPLSRFSEGQEVQWDPGKGLAYQARLLDIMGSGIKVRVVDREWKGTS